MDISSEALRNGVDSLSSKYAGLDIKTIVGDFDGAVKLNIINRPALITCFGSTIGNQLPEQRHNMLSQIWAQMHHGDALLLGVDLVKDTQGMVSAYQDQNGTLAAFCKNGLTVLNYELGADFKLESFEHVTTWNSQLRRVENCLLACHPQTITLSKPKTTVSFAKKEPLTVGISYKFSQESLRSELRAAGFDLTRWWTDAQGCYAIALSFPVQPPTF
ncbi:hypothetical protein K493DRAFT_320271 [Basidiobolus meristosporus CBS 931.73]|uniref:Histidine-specific methyltransferase SAM-dependent domain-containing protein n=1 Tax=Basidiobolus meristosporus CBS 931.73 TaxID=1314790 RepID=A0A1Y1XCH1_9FUNG|nr:hypothetical protein K493DRAFT_320271 [Basidiobolus meristosporus CBS 931.73]|eukprot:ORX83412.1 hypothetical protein K493DRAFT_320271 [Basidiobolus meristosporus CBS 931.73]